MTYLECIYIYIYKYHVLSERPFYHFIMSFSVFYSSLCPKAFFVCYNYSYSGFTLVFVCRRYLFPHLQRQGVCLCEMSLSSVEYRWVLFFLIQSVSLCLLIGLLSPFMCKVIINRYVLIVISLIVFWLFLCLLPVSVFFSCSLPLSLGDFLQWWHAYTPISFVHLL